MDRLDGQILHALQLAPRVPFRRIAAMVGAPEQSVSRRYRQLRRTGALRIMGLLNTGMIRGDARWVVRVHAAPQHMASLATTLVARSEVTHLSVLSGGTELVCIITAPLSGTREDLLLPRLARTTSVLDINVDVLLHSFGEPATSPWTGYGSDLDADEAECLAAESVPRTPPRGPVSPTAEDQPLLDALAEDGRTPHARLAKLTGWSVARVTRRLDQFETSRTLFYDVDLLPERLGFEVNAMLWLTVAPSALHRVGDRIAAHPSIAYAGAITGRSNLLAIAICRDVDDLYRYLRHQLGEIDEVTACDVSVRSQRLKQSGSVIAHDRLVNPSFATPRIAAL